MSDLNLLLDLAEMDEQDTKIIKAPFGYVGGKSRSLLQILPHLPQERCYVEPFGGSGTVLLSRPRSPLEVFNDRYSGVTDFYRCLADPALYELLIAKIRSMPNSREFFYEARDSWQRKENIVHRAAAWWYMIQLSFNRVGQVYLSSGHPAFVTLDINSATEHFRVVHERFHRVLIENKSWEFILKTFDSPTTVFYIDPPYVGTSQFAYNRCKFDQENLNALLKTVFQLKGFAAVSGYAIQNLQKYHWDEIYEWDSQATVGVHNTVYTKEILCLKNFG